MRVTELTSLRGGRGSAEEPGSLRPECQAVDARRARQGHDFRSGIEVVRNGVQAVHGDGGGRVTRISGVQGITGKPLAVCVYGRPI